MKRKCFKLLMIAVLIIFMFNLPLTLAASTTDLNNQKEENQNKIEESKEKKEEITAEKNQTVAEVEEISEKISDYESQISELNTKISDLNAKISESEQKLNEAQEDYTKQEELLEARLVATYEAGETSYLDFLLSSDGIIDFISNFYLVSEIATSDAELLDSIQKQKEEIQQAKTDLENDKKELDTSKAQMQSVTTQLQQTKSEKNAKVAQLTEEEQKIQDQIDELNQANKSIDAKIQAAIKKAQEASKNNSSSGSSGGTSGGGQSAPSSSGFIYPVPSAYSKITTGLYYSSGQYHGAVDFGSAGINGQPIYAVADGEVIVSERLSGSYGNYIIIMHNNGLFTLYAHGQDGSRTVSVGDTVRQGQQIMRVGTTGNSTGPHLHFEVRTSPGTYSCRVNPMNYLP